MMIRLFSLLSLLLSILQAVNARCPKGIEATRNCLVDTDCENAKDMCLDGGCCSVLGEAMSCPLYSYREYAMQKTFNDKCTRDEECPELRKCCQTILGKYCLQPEPEQSTCEGGTWPVALCLDGVSCPDGFECNEQSVCCPTPRWKLRKCTVNMTDEQLERLPGCNNLVHCQLGENCCHTKQGYRCVPFKPREQSRGMDAPRAWCPLYFYDYLDNSAADRCTKHPDCEKGRMCCQTVAGKYCLIPETKQYFCKGGGQPVAACEKKCPPNHTCVKSMCCPKSA